MTDDQTALPESDPLALFDAWFAEARAAEPSDANAMAPGRCGGRSETRLIPEALTPRVDVGKPRRLRATTVTPS